MIPGIWTNYLHDLSPEETVATFARKGWFALELSDEDGRAMLERGDPAFTGREFRRFAEDHGVSFPQGHLWLWVDVCGEDPAGAIDGLKRWLDLFAAIGIRVAVLHPGGKAMQEKGRSPEQIIAANIEPLRELCGHAAGAGITICLENLYTYLPRVEHVLSIIDAVGQDNLAICLDTGHLNIAGGGQSEFIRSARRRLRAIHIADNDGSGDQHLLPFGLGTVDWRATFAALKEVAYDGFLSFEVPGETRCPLPARLAKLDYIRAIWPVLLEGGG